MIHIDFQNECCGCSACAQICQRGCISMAENSEGFLIPQFNLEKCTSCNLCEKVCPVLNSYSEVQDDSNIPQNVYAAYNKNTDIRLKSSSGGIFSILAEYTINKGGVVFGARLSDDCKSVYHCMIDNIDDISLFRGSKYVQSDINGAYKSVKEQLDKGRFVLFSGTTCQVEGLILFLQKKYEKLLLIDFICHGVPSPKVFRKYIEYVEEKYSSPHKVFFRDKTNGWDDYSFHIDYYNGKKHIEPLNKNLYGITFLNDLCLRKSCYKCKFRKPNHKSDMTISDFWGIDKSVPEMNDNKGISAVIVNSESGKKIFNDIKCNMIYKEVTFYDVEKHNSVLRQPVIHKNRERFYKNLDNIDFKKNVKKNASQHSILISTSYKIVKVCLKAILGDENFKKLKMYIKKL